MQILKTSATIDSLKLYVLSDVAIIVDKECEVSMPLSNPPKIKLLKLYELLKAYSDEEKPLSTNQLCAMVKTEVIICDRRTLSVDIDVPNSTIIPLQDQ